jgi:hypothetical protein
VTQISDIEFFYPNMSDRPMTFANPKEIGAFVLIIHHFLDTQLYRIVVSSPGYPAPKPLHIYEDLTEAQANAVITACEAGTWSVEFAP